MHSENPPTSSAAPNLVLLPHARLPGTGLQTPDTDPQLLGLGLMQRTVLAARRAGCRQVFFLQADRTAPAGLTAIADWGSLAAAVDSLQPGPLIIAPQSILAETRWLERFPAIAAAPTAWAAIPDRLVVLSGKAISGALAALKQVGAHDMQRVEACLRGRFGPPAAVPSEIDPLLVEASNDIPAAERRLLRSLVKQTDGFMARHFDRHISLQISRRLASTSVKPTQITMISIAIGLCGAPFFLSALWYWQTIGALLFLLHSIVDGCDGELARLRFQESRYGGILDFWGDNIVHIAVFGCIAVGWARAVSATWPLLLGTAAIAGTLGSAGFVYWRQIRFHDGSGPVFTSVSAVSHDRLAGLLDAAARRDFIYMVPVLTLFGKASWFLVMAALGAPIFFFLLISVAIRERLQREQTAPT